MRSPYIISVLAFLIVGTSASADETAADQVRIMTDRAASRQDRNAAEDALSKLPADQVLPELLPRIAGGLPPGGIWNSNGREQDRDAPVEWQIHYAVSRSWHHQLKSLPSKTGGTLLLDLLKKTSAPNAQIHLINAFHHHWAADAEATLAVLLKEPKANIDVRTAAGLMVLLHGKEDYHDLLVQYAGEGPLADRKHWYELLVDPRHRRKAGIDPRVVRLGFDPIQAERKASPKDKQGAYALALRAGDHVGQEFKPDQRLPRYQGKHGLTDEFFGDTVKNALHWWEENKGKYEK